MDAKTGKVKTNSKGKPRYKVTPPERIRPTVGQNVATVSVNHVLLKFWDLGGQASLRLLWANYYLQCHSIIFVVDLRVEARERLEEAKQVLLEITADEANRGVFEAMSIPILMLANKQEARGGEGGPECIEIYDLKEVFNEVFVQLNANDSKILPVSALTGYGIKEAMDWLVVRLERNKGTKAPNMR